MFVATSRGLFAQRPGHLRFGSIPGQQHSYNPAMLARYRDVGRSSSPTSLARCVTLIVMAPASLNMPWTSDELHRRAKRAAVDRDQTLREFVMEAIERAVDEHEAEEDRRRRRKR